MVFQLNIYELVLLLLSAIPVFSIGLIEDLGFAMSPRIRLIFSAISGILVVLIFQVWIKTLGIPGVDALCFAICSFIYLVCYSRCRQLFQSD